MTIFAAFSAAIKQLSFTSELAFFVILLVSVLLFTDEPLDGAVSLEIFDLSQAKNVNAKTNKPEMIFNFPILVPFP